MSHVAQTDFMTLRGKTPIWQLGVLAALSLLIYWSTLVHLVGEWLKPDSDFSHGFLVPIFSCFVVWQERHRLARIAAKPAWSGIAVLLLGLGLLILGQMGAELFLSRSSLLLVLAGVIILFFGWDLFRAVLFPWAFLLLMIPIPVILFNQITFPLQLLASRIAAAVLPLLGVPVLRQGNIITTPYMPLEVAVACSGIRSLMALVTLAIIYGYLIEKRMWMRWMLIAASLPIALAANCVRIIVTGLLVYYWNPDKAAGAFHTFEGWFIFVLSLCLLLGVHKLLGLLDRQRELTS